MRIALFTLEAAPSAEAIAGIPGRHGAQVVLIGRSDPYRPGAGGPLRQGWRHLRRSGPRLLPFLWAELLPAGAAARADAAGPVRRRAGYPAA